MQTFTVRVSDGVLATEANFDVNVGNVAPSLTLTGAANVDLGQSYAVTFSATDPGTDTVSAWLVNWGDGSTTALAGNVSGASHTYSQGGQMAVTVTATDEDGSYVSSPLAVKVIVPNRAPVVPAGQTASTNEDQSVTFTLAYGDPDGDALTVDFASLPQHGSLSGFNPATRQLTYTPDQNFNGSDGFRITVSDGKGGTTSADINLNVVPVNDNPVAGNDSYNVHGGQTLNIAAPGLLANDSDGDGDALQVQSIDITGVQGVVDASPDGHFSFKPSAGFSGDTSFKYTVIDGFGGSAQGIVTISVTNTAPVAVNDSYTMRPGQTLNIAAPGLLANDSDG
ncbi:Ig-like domain-containing protein, partial [Methylomonas koyamae]|uniref:Ig-like domain-containing protein n=1 Tax=Methylomonas koyamae TaxID=702114 RepID=UPI0012F6F6A1